MKKVSIIIPVYNVEKYLPRCLDSVLGQTYREIEVILVNDGSTDGSLELCNRYASQDDRVIVIDKPNGGPSGARNKGLDVATGEYICFVDSDDYIDSRMIETLNDNLIRSGAQAAKMEWMTFDESVDFKYSNKTEIIDHDIERYLLTNNNLYCAVRYMLPKDLVGDIRFDEKYKTGEDQLFIFDVLRNAESIVSSDYKGYFYYQNVKSLSHGVVNNNHYFDLQVREKIMQQVSDANKDVAKEHLLKGYLAFYLKALKYGTSCEQDIIAEYGKIVRQNYRTYIHSKNMGFKRKLAVTGCMFGNGVAKIVAKFGG
ncbi:MAG: glycosyltransferase family 2 protein [Christensenellales bacterium]